MVRKYGYGRCPRCRIRHHLTAAGVLVNHPPQVPIRCPGSGGAPIDPAEDDTPDWRDTISVWDANVRLAELGDKVNRYGHLTDHERAEGLRVRRVRDDARAGNARLPKGAPK